MYESQTKETGINLCTLDADNDDASTENQQQDGHGRELPTRRYIDSKLTVRQCGQLVLYMAATLCLTDVT